MIHTIFLFFNTPWWYITLLGWYIPRGSLPDGLEAAIWTPPGRRLRLRRERAGPRAGAAAFRGVPLSAKTPPRTAPRPPPAVLRPPTHAVAGAQGGDAGAVAPRCAGATALAVTRNTVSSWCFAGAGRGDGRGREGLYHAAPQDQCANLTTRTAAPGRALADSVLHLKLQCFRRPGSGCRVKTVTGGRRHCMRSRTRCGVQAAPLHPQATAPGLGSAEPCPECLCLSLCLCLCHESRASLRAAGVPVSESATVSQRLRLCLCLPQAYVCVGVSVSSTYD
jgi:hypothetical protein